MKRIWWILLFLGVAACGASDTSAGSNATATTTIEGAGADLSGVSLEVHQAPG